MARRPHETHPLRKFRTAIQVFDLHLIWAVAAQASVPAEPFPHPFDGGKKGLEQQTIMVNDFADAPFFGSGSLPELGVGQTIQHAENGFTLGVEKVEVFRNDCWHKKLTTKVTSQTKLQVPS